MASGWVKSLQCKSRAWEDVYNPKPKILIPSGSCRKSVQNIKDVMDTHTTKPKPRKVKPPLEKHPSSKYPPTAKPEPASLIRSRTSTVATRPPDPFLPSLTELPMGHPSRNVVEIIFHTSWGPKPFAGQIQMIFKVLNASKTVARFEEYRETVKARAPTQGTGDWDENARCVADGNEVMRFQSLGPTSGGGAYNAAAATGVGSGWSLAPGESSAIRTFSGSGEAHDSGGRGRGRRAMMVCRVIAGRVSNQIGFMDSVSGDNGELFVFDSRAVLPCFLIIYKL